MTREPEKRFEQVKHDGEERETPYSENAGRRSRTTGHGARTPPVHTHDPEFVEMSEDQRQAAVEALVELLVEARERRAPGPRG